MILTAGEVRELSYNAGFRGKDLDLAVQIASCESGFNTDARNYNPPLEDSRGLFQINLIAHPYFSMLDLYNPEINASCAYSIFIGSNFTFNAWTCNNLINPGSPFSLVAGLALIGGIYYFITRS